MKQNVFEILKDSLKDDTVFPPSITEEKLEYYLIQ